MGSWFNQNKTDEKMIKKNQAGCWANVKIKKTKQKK